MSAKTGIEWTDATWSPIRVRVREDAAAIATAKGYTSLVTVAEKMAGRVGPHCEHVSPGCANCYAETNNHRCLPANGTGLPYDRRSRDLVEAFVDAKILLEPLGWKKPRKMFVENQSDLFGEWVTDEMLDQVFAVMALCPQHTLRVLTKRPERMLAYLTARCENNEYRDDGHGLEKDFAARSRVFRAMVSMLRTVPAHALNAASEWQDEHYPGGDGFMRCWPLPNVWLGVSVENQKAADARLDYLCELASRGWQTMVSFEPLLSAVDPGPWWLSLGAKTWAIVGGESGPGARPMRLEWAKNLVEKCVTANVPVFVKQLGHRIIADPLGFATDDFWESEDGRDGGPVLKHKKGGDWNEWPKALRIRQFPGVPA